MDDPTPGRLRRIAALALPLLLVAAGCGAGPRPSTTGLVSIGAGLDGPSGLVATSYATGLVHAAAFAFDDSERLWVATAASTDQGADGVYLVSAAGSPPTKVIAGVRTPLGLLWYQGALYVASQGGVDRYTGFDGSGFTAHTRVVAFPDGVGELNGLAVGSDGRISLGISAPCDHCTPTSPWSASVVSFEPDGSRLRVDVRGVRAAVGLVHDPVTGALLVTMDQRDDLGEATPGDWLAAVEPGQSWGYAACYGQGGTVCAGVPTPTATLDAHAGAAGVAVVSDELGAAVGHAAIVAEWNTGQVVRVALASGTANGTSDGGTATPFLTGIQNPEPVVLGPDGALYVADWQSGTVYRVTTA